MLLVDSEIVQCDIRSSFERGRFAAEMGIEREMNRRFKSGLQAKERGTAAAQSGRLAARKFPALRVK